ncbi:S-layer homology domain-containing protein [Bacillus sp. FJAT-42315]|uniref:S-layer homology domain-containing protein n=1 Tax=Bacillus sp. FJAT-42315 TaxID=2014077 RepID=UPI0018E2183F|nr:S-layer homology domain-containing protein [Bacillus sp. FJAT-42315]
MGFQAKSYRKFIATSATAALVATAVTPAFAAEFTDVNDRVKDAVNYIVDNGIASGTSATTFGTNKEIIRADAAVMIANALKLDTTNAPDAGFTDVPARARGAVNALKAAGILNGKTETKFGATDKLTRGEMAIIIARAYKLDGEGTQHSFTDVGKNYTAAVNALIKHEITLGKTATTFGTVDNITRGDFAVFVFKAEMLEAPSEDLIVKSATAIDAITISVVFEGMEEAVEITLEQPLVDGENTVTFTYEGKEYTATVNYEEPDTEAPLKVEEVKAINETSVTVTFPELEKDFAGATVEVKNPAGETVAVKAQDLKAGATEATFEFETALKDVAEGVWTVNGVEFNVDVTAPIVDKAEVTDYQTITINLSEEVTGTPVVTVNGTDVKGTLSKDGQSVTIKNDAGYAVGTYTVKISGLEDVAGNKLAETEVAVTKEASAVEKVTFTSTALNVSVDANGKQNGNDANVNFKIVDQYGQEMTVADHSLQLDAKYNNFPVATAVTNTGHSFTIDNSALVDGRDINLTVYKTVEEKRVEVGSATLKVVAEATKLASISDVKITTPADTSDLKAGDTVELTATVLDQFGNAGDVTGKKLRWTTSDKSIAAFTGSLDATFVDGEAGSKKIQLTLGKEGKATITAYLPDGSASKAFEITVGQGKLAEVITTDVTANVTNKATVAKANVDVNAEEGSTLKFENANDATIPVKASDVAFEVVAPTGFATEDVKVEKVVDTNGYLTGLKVTSNRAVLSTEEKAGDYGTGVNYTVKVTSTVEGVAEKTFTVNSKIDSAVKTISPVTVGENELTATGSVNKAVTFKNQYGEELNVKRSAVTLTSSNSAKVNGSAGNENTVLLTTDKDGKLVDSTSANDIVKGIRLKAAANAEGTYDMLLTSGTASTSFTAKVVEAGLVKSLTLGKSSVSVIADDKLSRDGDKEVKDDEFVVNTGDANHVYTAVPVSFKDQYGNDVKVDFENYDVVVTTSEAAKAPKTTLMKSVENGDADALTWDANGDVLTHIGVSAQGDDADTTFIVKAYKKGAEQVAKNELATAQLAVKVDKARELKTITATQKSETIALGGTTTVKLNAVDQYGKPFAVTGEWKVESTEGAFTFGNIKQVQDAVGEYTFTAKALDNGNHTITIKNGEVTETVNVAVAPGSELVQSLVLTGDDVNQDGTAKYAFKATDETTFVVKGVDANGKVIALDPSDIIWTSSNEAVAKVVNGVVTVEANPEFAEGKNTAEVTITAEFLGKKQNITLTVSKEAPKLVAGTLIANNVATLDADPDKAGIQIYLDGDDKDGEANGEINVTFSGKDQFGDDFATPTVISTSYNAAIVKEAEATNTVTITAVKAGDTKVRVLAGGQEIILDVKVTEDGAKAAVAFANAKTALQGVINSVTVTGDPATSVTINSVDYTVSVDGSDVATTAKWVTAAAVTTLQTAITDATTAKDAQDATVQSVNDAKTTLEAAIATFVGSAQDGTMM